MPQAPFPLWMKLLIIALALPALLFPAAVPMLGGYPELRALVWAYPLYGAATALCAWMCYRERPEVTWILLALLLLSHAGVLAVAIE